MDIKKHMHEITPLRIGHAVRVSPNNEYFSDWPDVYVVVGLEWEYQRGCGSKLNISIASDEEIEMRYGSTDGWGVDDLLPA